MSDFNPMNQNPQMQEPVNPTAQVPYTPAAPVTPDPNMQNQMPYNAPQNPYYYQQPMMAPAPQPAPKKSGKGWAFLGGFLVAMVVCVVTFVVGIVFAANAFSRAGNTVGSLPIPFAGDAMTEEQSQEALTKLDKLIKYIQTYYVEDVTVDDLLDGAYHGMVDSLGDKYAAYYNEDELVDFTASSNGNYVGIGVTVMLDESGMGAFVMAVNQSGGAYEVGLQAGDLLIAADDTELAGMTLNEMVALIRGEEGTYVKVTYVRDNEKKEVSIERRALSEVAVYYTMMENDIGYIALTDFTRVAVDQFYDALNDLQNQNMKSLILDLRDNGGGLVDVCVDIADSIIDTGLVTYMEDKYGNRNNYNATHAGELNIPIVVLINGNSASASELLTTCLIDYNKAITVGTQSFGKGIVQTTYNLMDGTAVKFTTAKYYSPNGTNVQDEGITPTYVVELPEDVIFAKIKTNGIPDLAQDTQLQKAIDILMNRQ